MGHVVDTRDEVLLSSRNLGETLRRYSVRVGDIFIADHGFADAPGAAHVVAVQADLIVRTHLVTLPLFTREGCRFDVLAHLRGLDAGHGGGRGRWAIGGGGQGG